MEFQLQGILFPKQRENQLFIKESPLGVAGFANGSEWMDSEHFVKYNIHTKHVKTNPEKNVLIIHDNSQRTLAAIEELEISNIIIISLPLNT